MSDPGFDDLVDSEAESEIVEEEEENNNVDNEDDEDHDDEATNPGSFRASTPFPHEAEEVAHEEVVVDNDERSGLRQILDDDDSDSDDNDEDNNRY